MGCDIHFYVERKIDGVWQQQFNTAEENPRWQKYWFNGRNYILFGLLAGVRNHDVDPLVEPRGVPNDMSDSLTKEWEGWAGDGHTPTYYSLAELLAAKDKKIMRSGYVDVSGYKQYLKQGYPEDFEYGLYGQGNYKVVDNKEMDRIVNLTAFLGETEYYTDVIWEESCSNICEPFWHDLERVRALDPDPNNLRCVFWFDN